MARIRKGRRKLEMVKIENESNRRVTFSKRRLNLFKKASELVSMCAAEVVLIVCSPMGKIYTFGHPSAETVIQRYLGNIPNNHQGSAGGESVTEAQRAMLAVDLTRKFKEKEKQLEIEKATSVLMEENIKNSPLAKLWSRFHDDELSVAELLQLKTALQKLKMDIEKVKKKKSLEMSQFMGFTKTCDRQNVGESSSTGAARGRLVELDLLGLGDGRRL